MNWPRLLYKPFGTSIQRVKGKVASTLAQVTSDYFMNGRRVGVNQVLMQLVPEISARDVPKVTRVGY